MDAEVIKQVKRLCPQIEKMRFANSGEPEEEERVTTAGVGGAFSVQLAAFERAALHGEEPAYPLECSRDAVGLANKLRSLAGAHPAAL